MRAAGKLSLLLVSLLLVLPPGRARAEQDAAVTPPESEEAPDSPRGFHHHGGSRHWSYSDKTKWASAFPHCGGHMQSPINIDTASTQFDPQLGPLLLSNYNLPPDERLSLRNNGHTVVLELPGNMTIAGGGFPQPYIAAQLHLHWGSKLGPGSEHTVDQHRYAGEVHVVYYNSQFNNFTEAEGQRGGLAVLAVFLQAGSDENESYQPLLKHLGRIPEEGDNILIEGFDVAKLLPDSLDRYFRYNGSLTTPPCYQTVNWTVFNQTVLLSAEQISELEETLWDDQDEHLQRNFRLPQSLHGRRVLASFPVNDNPAGILPAGQNPSSRRNADKQVGSSLHTGDVLAVLFAALFGITALAFLLYVRKHRSQKARSDAPPAKVSTLYTPAASDEHAL